MLLRGVGSAEIPEGTVRVARVVFPKGCLAMRMRDAPGPVFTDGDFEGLFPVRWRPAVGFLRQTWVRQFHQAGGAVRWREPRDFRPV